jgi:hypothetical protein
VSAEQLTREPLTLWVRQRAVPPFAFLITKALHLGLLAPRLPYSRPAMHAVEQSRRGLQPCLVVRNHHDPAPPALTNNQRPLGGQCVNERTNYPLRVGLDCLAQ